MYRFEYQMQGHGDVEGKCVVVDDASYEEHEDHGQVMTGEKFVSTSLNSKSDYRIGIAGLEVANLRNPSLAIKRNWANVTRVPQPGSSLRRGSIQYFILAKHAKLESIPKSVLGNTTRKPQDPDIFLKRIRTWSWLPR